MSVNMAKHDITKNRTNAYLKSFLYKMLIIRWRSIICFDFTELIVKKEKKKKKDMHSGSNEGQCEGLKCPRT